MKPLISFGETTGDNAYKIFRVESSPLEGAANLVGASLLKLEYALVSEFELRRDLREKGIGAPDGLAPNPWLKQASYQIILAWLATDFGGEIEDRIENEDRLVRGTKKNDRDIFQHGIVGLFAKHKRLIPPEHQSQFTDPMWYAFRHYISADHLNDFNRRFPGHRRKRGDWRVYIEPDLEEWVALQRAQSQNRGCYLDAHRGIYPAHIEDRVSAVLDDLAEGRARHSPSDDEWGDNCGPKNGLDSL